ncbi:hypothetical protein [Piscirickettsia litoralis]|uniref:Uncharacterized protein n=1 Tax=Piscirickettsia litoralis TaxID=1891921 RepID=A0ABX2ZXD3_9GAMM|nr:hypothetical protein [Piscirickettsia litoralis]ODN41269.1 hypothetical protein BGC07_17010 [Piscirickettsia litoralis]
MKSENLKSLSHCLSLLNKPLYHGEYFNSLAASCMDLNPITDYGRHHKRVNPVDNIMKNKSNFANYYQSCFNIHKTIRNYLLYGRKKLSYDLFVELATNEIDNSNIRLRSENNEYGEQFGTSLDPTLRGQTDINIFFKKNI